MTASMDIDDILDRNPGIDRELLEKSRELLRQLRSRGVVRKGYDLGLPSGGHRAMPSETPQADIPVVRRFRRGQVDD